jgi:predicted RNA binding protein YcfA (HicA-like mRNA interferase family)
MSNPRITFGQLRQLLLNMGFTETVTPKSHVFFAHEPSGAEVALPIYRSNRIVLPHHIVAIRIMLDAKGLMEGDEFDDLLSATTLPNSPLRDVCNSAGVASEQAELFAIINARCWQEDFLEQLATASRRTMTRKIRNRAVIRCIPAIARFSVGRPILRYANSASVC